MLPDRHAETGEERRGALVLVVEDNAEVRDLAVAGLHALGHRVISAADGETALGLVAAEPGIDLLVVDAGLPRINGGKLVAEAKRRHPQMRVLFMTGHGDGLERITDIGDKAIVMRKPFTREDLAREVGRAFSAVP